MRNSARWLTLWSDIYYAGTPVWFVCLQSLTSYMMCLPAVAHLLYVSACSRLPHICVCLQSLTSYMCLLAVAYLLYDQSACYRAPTICVSLQSLSSCMKCLPSVALLLYIYDVFACCRSPPLSVFMPAVAHLHNDVSACCRSPPIWCVDIHNCSIHCELTRRNWNFQSEPTNPCCLRLGIERLMSNCFSWQVCKIWSTAFNTIQDFCKDI